MPKTNPVQSEKTSPYNKPKKTKQPRRRMGEDLSPSNDTKISLEPKKKKHRNDETKSDRELVKFLVEEVFDNAYPNGECAMEEDDKIIDYLLEASSGYLADVFKECRNVQRVETMNKKGCFNPERSPNVHDIAVVARCCGLPYKQFNGTSKIYIQPCDRNGNWINHEPPL
jgi:hypothetical protein